MSDPTFLGMHGVVRDAALDRDGRAVYCRHECACSHCHVLSGMVASRDGVIETLRACLILMFALGLAGIFLALVAGHAWRA